MKNVLMPVVYISNEDKEHLYKSHHYKAKLLENGSIEIIDWLGRSADITMPIADFKELFVIITDKEFDKYEKYTFNGDTDKIDKYLTVLKAKYNLV